MSTPNIPPAGSVPPGSVPPGSTPPGGYGPGQVPPPYGSYDKSQWRAYREHQKAAWRAQRDAWKNQVKYNAQAWKYANPGWRSAPSIVGPVVLIGFGVVALLLTGGILHADSLWAWFDQWWPLLIIVVGLALVAEWYFDQRRGIVVRRHSGIVGLLIFFAVLAAFSHGWSHAWVPFRNNFGDANGDDIFNNFGLPSHENDPVAMTQSVAANADIQIDNPRGDVSVTTGEGDKLVVDAHQVAYSHDDGAAKKLFEATLPQVKTSGNVTQIKTPDNDHARVNLSITVPKGAHVSVASGRGDVTASELGAGVAVTAAHGDVHLNSINGAAQVRITGGKSDVSAHDVSGDLTLDGTLSDLTLSDIKGHTTQNGEIGGDVHLESTGPVHLHTSVSEVEVAALPGDLTLDNDSLHINQAKGNVRVSTHSKDIELNDIYGDSYVQNRNGRVSVKPAANFAVDVKNSKGDVEVTLPPTESASIRMHTGNGELISDYPLPSFDGANKEYHFTLGNGASQISLVTDEGDVHLSKGDAPEPLPSVTAPPKPPTPPQPGKPPVHLHSTTPPAQPVKQ